MAAPMARWRAEQKADLMVVERAGCSAGHSADSKVERTVLRLADSMDDCWADYWDAQMAAQSVFLRAEHLAWPRVEH